MKQTKISYSQSNVTPMVVKVWSPDQQQNPPETCEKSEFSGPILGLLIPKKPLRWLQYMLKSAWGSDFWYQSEQDLRTRWCSGCGSGSILLKISDLQKPSNKSAHYWELVGTYCNTPVRKVSPHPPQSKTVLLLGRIITRRACETFVLPSPEAALLGNTLYSSPGQL